MTIAQASRITDVSPDTLRYYERIGLISPVKRSHSGVRDYDEEDISWINFVKCMRGAGLSIDVLTRYLDMHRQGKSTRQQRRELLLEQRNNLEDKIKEMQETLKRLDGKIGKLSVECTED